MADPPHGTCTDINARVGVNRKRAQPAAAVDPDSGIIASGPCSATKSICGRIKILPAACGLAIARECRRLVLKTED
ncbi:MAG: hypothetical protein WAK31_06785 [Chthoniobacterales bacterium]